MIDAPWNDRGGVRRHPGRARAAALSAPRRAQMTTTVVGDVGGDTASALHHYFEASPDVRSPPLPTAPPAAPCSPPLSRSAAPPAAAREQTSPAPAACAACCTRRTSTPSAATATSSRKARPRPHLRHCTQVAAPAAQRPQRRRAVAGRRAGAVPGRVPHGAVREGLPALRLCKQLEGAGPALPLPAALRGTRADADDFGACCVLFFWFIRPCFSAGQEGRNFEYFNSPEDFQPQKTRFMREFVHGCMNGTYTVAPLAQRAAHSSRHAGCPP
jgi:hypothetical protein